MLFTRAIDKSLNICKRMYVQINKHYVAPSIFRSITYVYLTRYIYSILNIIHSINSPLCSTLLHYISLLEANTREINGRGISGYQTNSWRALGNLALSSADISILGFSESLPIHPHDPGKSLY